ncbi:MAG: type II toxin-antitoxin system HicB family antitoxin [Tannerella sp.]|jgi:predicted HicB family RNase H-like nuclease|nr:type II toxin-antitoxin system HicB family antitoxin [Tannerella sp.]
MGYLKYKNYMGSVEYSEEDDCLCGKVLGMTRDSITYEGKTIDELKADFEAGIDSYLEGCEEMGIIPRKGYNGIFNVRIPTDIHCRVAILAEETGMSINAIVRESIERRLETLS